MPPEKLVEFFKANERIRRYHQMGTAEKVQFYKFLDPDIDLDTISEKELYQFFSWIRTKSGLPSVRLDLNIPHAKMYEEGMKLYHWAHSHRGSAHKGWKSIVVHGIEYDKTDDAMRYGYENRDDAPHTWTIASAAAPVTTNWFINQFPFESYYRIRFMYLEPGGYILPHNDNDTQSLSAINIALNNPPGCTFVHEGQGPVSFAPGDVRYIDTHYRHAVWNRSEHVRVHMIAHSKDWGNRAGDFIKSVIRGYLKTQV